jgi:Cu-processing system ATP-binding protein
MTGMTSPVITLRSVSKRYGAKEVLHNVDLDIEAGECVALIGHNGAGKTTLLKILLGLTRPSGGSVRIEGQDPVSARSVAARRGIGYLPESIAFHDAMTGLEVLTFYARLKGEPLGACADLLARVGLSEAAARRVTTYSKGMRQRLGLAQALLGEPRLLFLDEPTTGLDPSLRRQFYELIQDVRGRGATVLLSSHALGEVEGCANRMAIMKEGRLVAFGTLDELRVAAKLPVHIHVAVRSGMAASIANDIGAKANLLKVNDTRVDLTCGAGDKMDVVRQIASLGTPVTDVNIVPPNLDEIYAYYVGDGRPL